MKFIIKEISSTRTEVRLSVSPIEIGGQFQYLFGTTDGNFDNNTIKSKYIPPTNASYVSPGPNPGIIRIIVAYLKDFIGSPEASRDYVLTTAIGSQIPIVNIAVDDINLITLNNKTVPTILIKLTEELPASSGVLENVNIQKQIFTTQEQEVYYIPKTPITPTFFGLDYDEDSINRITTADTRKLTFENYNEITGALALQDDTIIHEILSQSEDNLNVDYSTFGNHVYYGSAVSKLRNFKHKVSNIESKINLISQSLQLTSSNATNTLRINAFKEIQVEKSSFTSYERNLYYNSGLNVSDVLSIGPNYISNTNALSPKKTDKLQNNGGFQLIYKSSGSVGSHIPLFEDKYKVEDKPFYNNSGSFYLSFLIKGDEQINGNVTWENRNETYTPKLPFDTLYSSSLLTPNIKSGSWVRHIYHASMSYFAPVSTNPVLGYAGSITDFTQGSTEVNVINTPHKTGSYAITLGNRYTNLATVLTSSGIPFTGSIVPAGELFRIGIDTATALTSSYITDVKLTKENPIDYKPFMEVYSTGSVKFETWYNNQYVSASDYDDLNIYSLYNNLPQYIITNNENFELQTFITLLGEHFDYIKAHIDNYRYIFNTGYDTNLSTPDKLLPVLAESMGWEFKLPFGKTSDAEIQNYLGSTLSAVDENNSKTIMNNIWRNVVNNLPYIYKSKGTIRSISALLNSYGMPSSILKIREHGASLEEFDKSILSDDSSNLLDGLGGTTGNTSFTQKTDNFVSYLIQSSNDKLGLGWRRDSVDADVVEFVFKPSKGTNTQTIVHSSGSLSSGSLWDIILEPSASTNIKSRLQFRLNNTLQASESLGLIGNRVSMSTDYHAFKNQNFWNVSLQRTSGPSGSGANLLTSHSYQLYIGEQHGDVLRVFEEVSMSIGGASYVSGAANWIGTGSRPADDSGNLVIGQTMTGSIAEIRTWKNPLSASKFKQHIYDKKSVVGNTILSSRSELIYHFRLNENYISGSTNPTIKDSNPNNIKDYSFALSDIATGSLTDSPSYVEDEIERIQFNVRVGGSVELNDNSIIIDPKQHFINNLNPSSPSFLDIYNPIISSRKASSILELVRSPHDVINDFIMNQLGNFDFNDKFADPRDINNDEYVDLERFSQDFFNHYNIHLNVNKYITAQSNIFNSDLIDSLKRLVPARASFEKIGIELKPTYLHRQKIQNHKLEKEIIDINGELPITDWDENKYTHIIVETPDLYTTKNGNIKLTAPDYDDTGSLKFEQPDLITSKNGNIKLTVGDDDDAESLKFEQPTLYTTKNANLDITSSIILYPDVEQPKQALLHHFKKEYTDTGSLLSYEGESPPVSPGDFLFQNGESFSTWALRSYEDNDIVKLWGTASSDRHFIQSNTGSEGKHGNHNTYHYDNRQIFQSIGDVETLSGSYNVGSFFIDFTGTITDGVFTASKDFSNQTFILSDTGLGLRPVGTTYEFKPTGSISFKGGKFLDETFVYPSNHHFILGSSKDDLDIIYKGIQNSGQFKFNSKNWKDVSANAFYSITTTGGTAATVTYSNE
jgi:hypothetical protein